MSNDKDFMLNMKHMFDYDDKKISSLLQKMNIGQIMNLIDAVKQNDKELAKSIIDDVEMDKNNEDVKSSDKKELIDDLTDDDVDDDKELVNNNDDENLLSNDRVYNIGDQVSINGNNAIVKITDAPNDTIGVMMKGKLKMVNKNEVEPLNENVLGLSVIPDINRIKQLAGLDNNGSSLDQNTSVTVPSEDASVSSNEQCCNQEQENCQQEEECCDYDKCMNALSELENCLPNIKVSELKDVRKRLFDLQAKMNESLIISGKTIVEKSLNRRKKV